MGKLWKLALLMASLMACISVTNVKGMDVQVGRKEYSDGLIHTEIAKKDSALFRKQIGVLMFPPQGQQNDYEISFIRITDQNPARTGEAHVVSGGVGYKHVALRFKSARGEGYNFLIEIYGAKNPANLKI